MEWLSRQRWYPLLFLAGACICAGWMTVVFFRDPGVEHWRSAVPEMVYGEAWKPFVHRALAPALIRGALAISPGALHTAAESFAANTTLGAKAFSFLNWQADHALLYLYAGVLSFVLFTAFVYPFRSLFRALYVRPLWLGDIIALAVLLALPIGFHFGSKIYDPATLFLTTLALAFMCRERWPAYFAVFFLAAINKETAIILAFAFGAYFWDKPGMKRVRYGVMLGAQFAVLAAVKVTINSIFAGNPGEDMAPIRLHLSRNVGWLFQDYGVETLVAWAALMLLTVDHWSHKPLFVRRAMVMAVPLVGLGFFMGVFWELRGYYELYPLFAILIGHSIARLMDLRPEPARVAWTAELDRPG